METINVFCRCNDTRSLHKELTNILLLCTEESNYYYCSCDTNKRATCQFVNFVDFCWMQKLKICHVKSFYN